MGSTYNMVYDEDRKMPVFFDFAAEPTVVKQLDVSSGASSVLAEIDWDRDYMLNLQTGAVDAKGGLATAHNAAAQVAMSPPASCF